MKKLIIALMMLALPGLAAAAGAGPHLDKANIDLTDNASLQRGARLFVNYCLNCHSANFMRYNRMGKDLGISDELVEENLLFTTDKVAEPMAIAMTVDCNARYVFADPNIGAQIAVAEAVRKIICSGEI